MQLKRFVSVLVVLVVGTVLFSVGYSVGKNRTVRRELSVAVPMHVQIYRSAKLGETNKVAGLASMVLMGKISRYDSLESDWWFRTTGGGGLFQSSNLQMYVQEARTIIATEHSNLVTIVPP